MARQGWHGESRRHAEAAERSRRNQEVDSSLAKELYLWAMNTQELYQNLAAWHKNYKAKKEKGTFNRTLAIKGLANNFVPRVITSYRKENGFFGTVNQATKDATAIELLDDVMDDSRW